MNRRNFLVYSCTVLSGAAGLLYEVVWSRQLSLFLGTTSQANTAVITAYMLGLAAGSWVIGRQSDRLSQPLRAYAWFEIGIGLFGATTPWLFAWLQSTYAGWAGEAGVVGAAGHLVRFTIALVALLIPTFLMGGTLPLLVRGVLRHLPELGSVTGRLYGLNTIGATLGTALTGFTLLPSLGVSRSIMVGVAANFAVAACIEFLVPRHSERPEPNSTTSTPRPAELAQPLNRLQFSILLASFGVAGFAALLAQLAWIRALILVIGGSVYAFTATLTAFLGGIGLGSLIYARWLSRWHDVADRLQLAAWLAFVAGTATLGTLSLIALLPGWFLDGYEAGWIADFGLYQYFIFALSCSVMVLPTLCMGALFPLLAITGTASFQAAGQGIGRAYAVNTAGTILGALLGGLVLLQWFGIHYAIVLTASLYLLTAVAFWIAGGKGKLFVPVVAVVLFGAAVWATPAWNRSQAAYGVFQHTKAKLGEIQLIGLQGVLERNVLRYYKEGLGGTVAVVDAEDQLSLVINGKVDATSRVDLKTQVGLTLVATLLQPDARDALVIGLGSGISAGALATRDSVEEITVLEISPEVIAAAELFSEHNHDVLHNPKLQVIEADARNFLLATRRQWDLVVSQPSNPWVSGISNLFTEEFFRVGKSRLAPGGVMAQWFQSYQVATDDVKSVLKGFSDHFRYVLALQPQPGDLILYGSDAPLAFSMRAMQAAFNDSQMGPELRRAGWVSERELLLHFLFDDDSFRHYVRRAKPNTDDRPLIEFSAPRSLYAESREQNELDMIRSLNNQRFNLPLSEQFSLREGALVSHTLDLTVEPGPGGVFSDIQSGWQLWHFLQPGEAGESVGISDFRELSWVEAAGLVRVQVVKDSYAPTAEQRNQYLFNNMALPADDYGTFQWRGDAEAQWMLGTATSPDRLEIRVFWTCPDSDGGSLWYIVSYQRAGILESDAEQAAFEFASRFSCQ